MDGAGRPGTARDGAGNPDGAGRRGMARGASGLARAAAGPLPQDDAGSRACALPARIMAVIMSGSDRERQLASQREKNGSYRQRSIVRRSRACVPPARTMAVNMSGNDRKRQLALQREKNGSYRQISIVRRDGEEGGTHHARWESTPSLTQPKITPRY